MAATTQNSESTAEPTRAERMVTKAITQTERAERQAQVFQLRARGVTFSQIASKLGVSPSTAHADMERAIRSLIPVETAEEFRASEVEHLDFLRRRASVLVEHDEPAIALKAIGQAIGIAQRRSKLLGLDAPAELKASVTHEMSPSEIDQAIKELLAEINEQAEQSEVDTVVE